jgi:hypothetical protein
MQDGERYWEHYARFALKYNMPCTAEHYLKLRYARSAQQEALQGGPQATLDRLTVASLYVQEGQYRQAQELILHLIRDDWKHIHSNLLLALLHERQGQPGLSRKYFAIAKVKRMRDLGLLSPKSSLPNNLRTQPLQEFKVEIIDFRNVNTKDQQLPPEQNDLMFFEFVDFLLANNLFNIADQALTFVND